MQNQKSKLSSAGEKFLIATHGIVKRAKSREEGWRKFLTKFPQGNTGDNRAKFRQIYEQVWQRVREEKNPFNTEVRCSITKGSDINGPGLWLLVEVKSNVKPLIWGQGQRLVSLATPVTELVKLAEVLANVIAMEQNTKYGDSHDPAECGRMAVETVRKMMSDLEKRVAVVQPSAYAEDSAVTVLTDAKLKE